MPLNAIRTRLRLIRYYSRARPNGRWHRVHDLAMAAALILAWPLTWLLDRAWVARSAPVMNSGFLYRGREGQLFALTASTDPIDGRTTHDADLHGSYLIDLTDEEHGWPFVTSLGVRRGTIKVQLFEDARSLGAADLPPESPVRAAIEDELADTGQGVAAAVVWGSEADRAAVSRPAGAWLANGIVWSLALVIAARLLVGAARLSNAIASAGRAVRKRHRASTGRCAGCGYDLRGSTFGERCPECGALL